MIGFPPAQRLRATLRYIRGYQLAKGYSPSFREIAVGIGLSPNSKATVPKLLDELEARGLLRRRAQRKRAIELLCAPPIPHAPDGAPLFVVPIHQETPMAKPHRCDVPGCQRTRRRWQRLCERCYAALPGDIRTGIIDAHRANRRAEWKRQCRRAADHLGLPGTVTTPATRATISPEEAFARAQNLLGER